MNIPKDFLKNQKPIVDGIVPDSCNPRKNLWLSFTERTDQKLIMKINQLNPNFLVNYESYSDAASMAFYHVLSSKYPEIAGLDRTSKNRFSYISTELCKRLYFTGTG